MKTGIIYHVVVSHQGGKKRPLRTLKETKHVSFDLQFSFKIQRLLTKMLFVSKEYVSNQKIANFVAGVRLIEVILY